MAISPHKVESFSELHQTLNRLLHQCEHWAAGQEIWHTRVEVLLQELLGRYTLPQSSQFTVPQHDLSVPSQPSIPKLPCESNHRAQGMKLSGDSDAKPCRKPLAEVAKRYPIMGRKGSSPFRSASSNNSWRPANSNSSSEKHKVAREISEDNQRELNHVLHDPIVDAGKNDGKPTLHDPCHENLDKNQENRDSLGSKSTSRSMYHRHGAGTVEAESRDITPTNHWREMIREESKKHNRWSHLNPIMDRTNRLQEKGRNCINRMVTNRYYEAFMVTLVVGNAVFLGWQVSRQAENRTLSYEHEAIETCFCSVFVVELFCRMVVEKELFLWGPDCLWNLFDCLVVGIMVVEQVLSLVNAVAPSVLQSMSILRALRLVRLLRALRIIRVLSLFRELRMMVQSITSSMLSLVWVIMILGMMFYVFAILLTQGMIEYCDGIGWTQCDGSELNRFFGSLPTATLTLFEAMSGGISWGEIVDALKPLSRAYTYLFLAYISFSLFAVVNIVTGIFVETAIGSGHQDRDAVIQENMAQKRAYVESIHDVFHELDLDNNGQIGLQEMETAIEDVNMVSYFHSLGLEIHDVRTLFVLLDRDQTGIIDIEEFLVGCLRLKGEAKSLDVAKIHYEIEWVVHNLESLTVDIRTLLELEH